MILEEAQASLLDEYAEAGDQTRKEIPVWLIPLLVEVALAVTKQCLERKDADDVIESAKHGRVGTRLAIRRAMSQINRPDLDKPRLMAAILRAGAKATAAQIKQFASQP